MKKSKMCKIKCIKYAKKLTTYTKNFNFYVWRNVLACMLYLMVVTFSIQKYI